MATTVSVTGWDEVEELQSGEFPVLPAGVYDGYFADWTKKVSGKGKEYYSPQFTIEDESGAEFRVWGYWENTAKNRGYMKHDLAVLGVELRGLDVDDVEGLEDKMNEAKGESCRLRLRIANYPSEDDEGNPIVKEKNEIRAILRAR